MARSGSRSSGLRLAYVACALCVCVGHCLVVTRRGLQCSGRPLADLPDAAVLISEKLLWCPTAKAGSTSIYEMLDTAFSSGNETYSRCFDSCPEGAFGGHVRSAYELLTIPGGTERLCSIPSFMIVRNPWDRLISAYLEKIVTGKFSLPGVSSFESFVRYVTTGTEGVLVNNIHWLSYHARCNTGSFNYTTVVHLEDPKFSDKIQQVFSSAGIDIGEVGHMNSKATSADPLGKRLRMFSENLTAMASAELVQLVQEKYADDIRRYGYAYDKYP